eukprot:6940282-Pyramimonas_sp.AAC.1
MALCLVAVLMLAVLVGGRWRWRLSSLSRWPSGSRRRARRRGWRRAGRLRRSGRRGRRRARRRGWRLRPSGRRGRRRAGRNTGRRACPRSGCVWSARAPS